MNTLLLVAIVGVAAAALGIGSLGNTITLNVQDLGVGETDLASPITEADVDFEIARASGMVLDTLETHNVISACYIHVVNADPLNQLPGVSQIDLGSTVYCKLTDIDGNVVAEGTETAGKTYGKSETITVIIDPSDFPNNKVQNVHDIIVVVQGP